MTDAATDVASVLAHYRQLLLTGHQQVIGDPLGLEAAAHRLNGTVRQVDGARDGLAGAHRALADAWQAPSYRGFDRFATGSGEQLGDARSALGRQEEALRQAASRLRAATVRSVELIAQYDRSAAALAAGAGQAGADGRLVAEADRMGRTYAEAAAGIRRELGAGLLAIAATLAAPVQGGRRITSMTLEEVNQIINNPGSYPFGTVAGAIAHRYLLEHQEAQARWGIGTIHGTNAGAVPHPLPAGHPGVRRLDCTTFAINVLREAMTRKGMLTERQWQDLVNEARNNQRYRTPGSTTPPQLTGTELVNSLDRRFDWDSVFWSPDPTNPADRLPRHREDYNTVNNRGEYWGVPVDNERSIINYRRTSTSDATDTMRLNQLEDLPFGAVVAGRGTHMAAVVNGEVYQVHWDRPATDPTTIEATPLEDPRWVWNSGIIAAPKDDLNRALAGSGSR